MSVKRKVKFNNIILIILGAVVVGLVIFFLSQGGLQTSGNQKEELAKRIEAVGGDFYENMYYGHITSNRTEEEIKEFLGGFSEIGIKVDLDNLSRFDRDKYPNLLEEFVNKTSKVACDPHETKVIIYPKAPFEATHYTLGNQLDCGFED